MSVFRKKRKNGTLSENWYFEFEIEDKRYRGSTYKTSKLEAIEFERVFKNDLKSLAKEQNPKTKKANLIRFRDKITSEIQGDSIKIEDVWNIFKLKAPAKMRRLPSQKGWEIKEGYWNDFLSFIKELHPECKTMQDVTGAIAEEYIGLVKTSGKYQKKISYKGRSYKSKITQLSASSINEYIMQIRQIFRILSDQASLLENPFANIEKVQKRSKKRDVFEIHELEEIDSYFRNMKNDPPLFIKDRLSLLINEAVFIIGINTGMRRGDISLLKWSDINFTTKVIKRELLKTEEEAIIPMSMRLYTFLKEKEKKKVNEFVTPELADMYQRNAEGISYRFKKMLQHLEIDSLKLHEGRSRRTSNKDIHSLRHTFCYLHGMQGTRLIVLQSMVGHIDKKMTESYMMHQTEQLKKEAIEKFSLMPFQPISLKTDDERKKQIIEMVNHCESDLVLKEIIEILKIEIQQRGALEGGTHHKL